MGKDKRNKKNKSENIVKTDYNNEGFISKNVKNIKDLIAPAGIDASHTNHLEITSSSTRYARSMLVTTIPRMCTFPEFLRSMYTFGDIKCFCIY